MPIITTLASSSARGFNPYANSPITSFVTKRYDASGAEVDWTSTAWPIFIYAEFIYGAVTAVTVNGTSMLVNAPPTSFYGWCYGGTNGIQTVVLTLSGGGTMTQYFSNTYNALAPTPNSTSNLSSTYVVPSGVTQLYLEGSAAGGGGGGANSFGENYTRVGGGGGGGQAFRGTITVTPGEVITYTVGRQGYAAGDYAPAFGNYYGTLPQYYDQGNTNRVGGNGQATTISTSSGSLTLSAAGGTGGSIAAGGAGGSSGTKSGTEAANITFSNGTSGSNSQTGGDCGGYGVTGYNAAGRGGYAVVSGGTYYDPIIWTTNNPSFYYYTGSNLNTAGMRGGAAVDNQANAYSGFGGGGSGGWGHFGGSGNHGGGPGAPGYLIIKPVG